MNEYVLSVIGAVLLAAFLTAILPEGKTSSTIKGVTKVVCVLIIIAPILSFLSNNTKALNNKYFSNNLLETGIQTDEGFIEYVSEKRVEYAQRALEKELRQKFDVTTEIRFVWRNQNTEVGKYDKKEIYIDGIFVVGLMTIEKEKQEEIISYLTKNYCKEVLLE